MQPGCNHRAICRVSLFVPLGPFSLYFLLAAVCLNEDMLELPSPLEESDAPSQAQSQGASVDRGSAWPALGLAAGDSVRIAAAFCIVPDASRGQDTHRSQLAALDIRPREAAWCPRAGRREKAERSEERATRDCPPAG